MRGALRSLALSLVVLLATASSAFATASTHDNGEGLAGETNDKDVTFFSLGVLLFFFLVVVLGSLVQGRLERRKEEKKASKLHQRVGW